MNKHRFMRSAVCLSIALGNPCSPLAAHRQDHAARHNLAAPPAIAIATTTGRVEPTSVFINATAVLPFADGAVFHVYAAPERVTDIQLQPGEALAAVASGDTVRWVIGDTTSGTGPDKRVHVLVKPVSIGLATNLVVTTDRRTYHLALTSGRGAYLAALSWIYPQDALLALKPVAAEALATPAPAPASAGPDVTQLDFDYAMSGDRPDWRPLRAFDDGRQTFIEFPPTIAVGEAPPLFLVDPKGQAELVNYRQRGRFYVVDRIFNAAELRLGTKHQVVVRITRERAATSAARSAS